MSTGGYEIRRAVRADYLQIAALEKEVWRDYPNGGNIPDGEHTWRHWVEDAVVMVACAGEQVVGVALAFPTLSRGFCVHKVFVHKDLRGYGLGRTLLEQLLAQSELQRQTCFLTVSPANEKAVRLYSSLGFSAGPVLAGYYRPDEHRYEMFRP